MVLHVRSSKAFTLIEMLVAIVIIGISIMGLMEMSMVVMRNNLKNEIRNKAVEVIGNHLQRLTNGNYDNISIGSKSYTFDEKIRNMTVSFTVTDNVTKDSSIEAKNINSKIGWLCCGRSYNYQVKTVVTKNE